MFWATTWTYATVPYRVAVIVVLLPVMFYVFFIKRGE